jgi:Flp pilus assembly pilin Flp
MLRNLMARLWEDDDGALIAVEWIFLATILILGVITGMVAVRQAIIAEFHDIANALLALNQSFSFSGQSNCESSSAGAFFIDFADSIVVRSTVATPGGFDNRACD